VDFSRPVEALIPGATGRLLAALGRVETEMAVSTLAQVAGVGRTRASGILGELCDLGVVNRREVGRTVLVRLARDNAAGHLIERLANLHASVIEELRGLARDVEPEPASLSIFGSFARGEAEAGSDIDVLAVRAPDADEVLWASSLSDFARRARTLTGNPVDVIDYDLDELRRRTRGKNAMVGQEFWDSIRRQAVTLVGSAPADLLGARSGASR
jgi:predicted nucleotidyltransferase